MKAFDVFTLGLDQSNLVREAVRRDDLSRLLDDRRAFDADHLTKEKSRQHIASGNAQQTKSIARQAHAIIRAPMIPYQVHSRIFSISHVK